MFLQAFVGFDPVLSVFQGYLVGNSLEICYVLSGAGVSAAADKTFESTKGILTSFHTKACKDASLPTKNDKAPVKNL